MTPQLDFFQIEEVASFHDWLGGQSDEVRLTVAAEIAELRLIEIVIDFQSLRYLHSQSCCMQLLARLQDPSVIFAFQFCGLNHSEFTGLVTWHLRKIATTLPDKVMRASGAGRPPIFCEASADLFDDLGVV